MGASVSSLVASLRLNRADYFLCRCFSSSCHCEFPVAFLIVTNVWQMVVLFVHTPAKQQSSSWSAQACRTRSARCCSTWVLRHRGYERLSFRPDGKKLPDHAVRLLRTSEGVVLGKFTGCFQEVQRSYHMLLRSIIIPNCLVSKSHCLSLTHSYAPLVVFSMLSGDRVEFHDHHAFCCANVPEFQDQAHAWHEG